MATDSQQKINEILNKITSLELQMASLIAQAESEKGTRARMNDRIYKDIEKVETEMNELFHGKDGFGGIVVELDRLKQESEDRKEMKRHVRGLWGAVIILIMEQILLFIIKR